MYYSIEDIISMIRNGAVLSFEHDGYTVLCSYKNNSFVVTKVKNGKEKEAILKENKFSFEVEKELRHGYKVTMNYQETFNERD